MREYWQRRTLLIRGALPNFVAPVARARLFELARDPALESRLITAFDRRWSLEHGPFARLPSVRRAGWTLLVQGVDLHDDSAREFLSRFRFLPDARLDDLMISFATDGGGVGPHVDSYDVFLLQAAGQRRWRISRQRNLRPRRGSPLDNVAGFRASQEWLLEAGDMLYLPPGIAHEGVAVGECMTYSIGFRAPSYQQLLEPWFTEYAEHAVLRSRYADAGAVATKHAAALPRAMTSQVHAKLGRRAPNRTDTERFLLRYLTEPKATTTFDPPPKPLSRAEFRRAAAARGMWLDRKTRIIYSNDAVGVNGEWIKPLPDSRATLKTLGDQRALSPRLMGSLPRTLWSLLHDWHSAGWIIVAD